MLKPWQPFAGCVFEPVDVDALPPVIRDLVLSRTIEFVSLGMVPAGDYRLQCGDEGDRGPVVRYFQSSDGAVLGWVSSTSGTDHAVCFASILEDGTCVQTTTEVPTEPWSCCRFPVYVNFSPGCGLEDLLLVHLTSLAELEHGCGPTLRYDPSQLADIVTYILVLRHETEHGLGAPPESLPAPPAAVSELVSH